MIFINLLYFTEHKLYGILKWGYMPSILFESQAIILSNDKKKREHIQQGYTEITQ